MRMKVTARRIHYTGEKTMWAKGSGTNLAAFMEVGSRKDGILGLLRVISWNKG